MTTREEIFYNGDYLENFADHLMVNKHGKRRRKGDKCSYIFSHENFDSLTVQVSREWLGLGNAMSHEITLRGPRNQIKTFMEDAERVLSRAISSKDDIDNQMREPKKYDGVLRQIELGQANDYIGLPFLMTTTPWDSDVPAWANVGYLGSRESGLWIERGFNLSKLDRKPEEEMHVYEICGVNFTGGGRPPCSDTPICESDRSKYFFVDSGEFDEMLERIEDGRPVSIS